jgi:hypothetical protein
MKQEENEGWRFIMNKFRNWFMVYKYQPQTIFQLLCLEQGCNIPHNYNCKDETVNTTTT